MLYRIELPPNTTTPLSLFARKKLLCFCSCSCQQASIAMKTATAAQICTTAKQDGFNAQGDNRLAVRLYGNNRP